MPKTTKKERAVPALTKGKLKELTIEQAKSAVRKCLRGCKSEKEAYKLLKSQGIKTSAINMQTRGGKTRIFAVHFVVPGSGKAVSLFF